MVPNGQASLPAQNPISLGWVVMRCCKAFRGPPSGGRGAARAQRYRLCALCPPPPPQMMGSSHLKNSRITLLMGFSALGSCESCSVVLTGIPLSEYGGWGAHATCRCEPRLSLPHCVPCLLGFLMEDGGGHGERSARAKCQLYPPTYPFPGSSPAHHTASSWDPKIARPESPPMVQPTGAPPHSCFPLSDQRMPGDSWALPAPTHGCRCSHISRPSYEFACLLPLPHVGAHVCTAIPPSHFPLLPPPWKKF